MTVQYIHLAYEEFKSLETQMRAFKETTHKTEGGFYHKSIRLRIGGDLIMEFHGPLVGGYGHAEAEVISPQPSEPVMAAAIAEKTPEETTNETTDDTPAPRHRRRPPVDTGGEGSSTSDSGGEISPQTEAAAEPKTRRKRATKAEMVERRRLAELGESDETGEAGHNSVGETASELGQSEAVESLTDADMSKAASEGARVIGPEAVTAILSEFGVASVNELPQERRQEFVDNVDAAKAKTGEDE